jgi:K+-transporting ATPase A subunit
MKKEEFPTFLNQRPAIVFGRTGRELIIITIGLSLGYLAWLNISSSLTNSPALTAAIKLIIAALLLAVALVVAFIKIATRPLEEWAIVWVFYMVIPKVFIYMPAEEIMVSETQDKEEGREKIQKSSREEDDDERRW